MQALTKTEAGGFVLVADTSDRPRPPGREPDPAVADGSPLAAFAAAAVIGAWLLLPSLPMFWVSSFDLRYVVAASEAGKMLQAGGLVLALLALTLQPGKALAAATRGLADPPVLLLCLFFFYAAATSMQSVAPTSSLFQAAAGFVAVLLMRCLAATPARVMVKVLPWFTILIIAFIGVLYLKFGYGNRSFGGTQPNAVAKLAIVGGVLGCLSRRRAVAWLSVGAALAVALAVNSRGALVVLVVFWGIYLALLTPVIRLVRLAAIVLFLVVGAVAVAPDRAAAVMIQVLALDDPNRGLEGGLLTGRQAHWAEGLMLFERRPTLGYGFDTRVSLDDPRPERVSAHSGVINGLLDNGVIGMGLFLAAIGSSLILRIRALRKLRGIPGRPDDQATLDQRRVQVTLLAAQAGSLGFLVLDPQYFGLGLSYAVFLLWAWVTPRSEPERATLPERVAPARPWLRRLAVEHAAQAFGEAGARQVSIAVAPGRRWATARMAAGERPEHQGIARRWVERAGAATDAGVAPPTAPQGAAAHEPGERRNGGRKAAA